MSSQEVGHLVAQTWPNYLKLQILGTYNNPRIGQDSEFAQFPPKALLMSKLTKLLPLVCLKKYFLEVLERLSEFL